MKPPKGEEWQGHHGAGADQPARALCFWERKETTAAILQLRIVGNFSAQEPSRAAMAQKRPALAGLRGHTPTLPGLAPYHLHLPKGSRRARILGRILGNRSETLECPTPNPVPLLAHRSNGSFGSLNLSNGRDDSVHQSLHLPLRADGEGGRGAQVIQALLCPRLET